jgi:competence protein ComEC
MQHLVKTINLFQYPLILATGALITGILVFNGGFEKSFFALTILITILCYYLQPSIIYSLLLAITFLIIGYCRTYFYYSQYHLFSHAFNNKKVSIIGCITDLEKTDHPFFDSCITMSVHQLQEHKNTPIKTAQKTIQLYTKSATIQSLEIDDVLEIKQIKLHIPSKDSLKFYLMKTGIDATCFTPTIHYTLLTRPTFSINRFVHYQKNRINNTIKQKLSPYSYALFSSLFLGCKKTCKKEIISITEQFKQWGILHYLARSGLHLVIFIFIWQTLLRAIPLSLLLKNVLILLLGFFYFLLTWPSISFIRAFIIFLLYKLCSFTRVQSSLIYLLALCCFFILLYSPLQLFALDFQLSFILTFAIAWFSIAYPSHTI